MFLRRELSGGRSHDVEYVCYEWAERKAVTDSIRVLLVDDTKSDYLLTRMLLEQVPGTRYDLDWVEDYDRGLSELRNLAYGVCLVDYGLRNRTGVEFIRAAIAAGIHTPKILFTGQGDPEIDREALQAGAADYLDKGEISATLLDRSIRYALEQQKVQRQLHDSEMLLRSTLDALSMRIAILDEAGTILEVNHAWTEAARASTTRELQAWSRGCNYLGYLEREEARDAPSAKDFGERLRSVLSGRSAQEYFEFKWTADSASFWGALRLNRFHVGGAMRVAVSIEDISTRMNLERQLRQAQKMEAIGQLAGGIAHDFNNLLTVILGYGSTILATLDGDHRLRPKMEAIEAAGKRAVGLTRQLLAFSRKQVLQPKVIDLNEIIDSMRPILRHVTRGDIRLELQLAPSLRPIKADPSQLEQVLMNLIINARDAMESGGRLTVATKNVYLDNEDAQPQLGLEPGYYATITVSDTGAGMDSATQARIFEPFFTTKPVGQGTGLGLSTVYGIVKQSGGHITVSSQPGEGSTFCIYLPSSEQKVEPTAPEEDPGSLRGTETILLTEDEDAVREYTAGILRALGYTVYGARDIEDAITVCADLKGDIALLITDIVMPKANGREVAQILAPVSKGMEVLYISGYSRNAVATKGLLEPGLNFLEKPFTPNQLASRVKQILEKRRNSLFDENRQER